MRNTAILILAALLGFAAPSPAQEAPLHALSGASEWINSAPLKPDDLRGKVVLVDFWTYSCINCLRTLPYVRAWAEKYRAHGLVVIGVHSPEFAFEKESAHVRRAVRDLGISYAVANDSEFKIWRAFNNRAWPAFYFVDAQGHIRDRVLGEGRYEMSEKLIQQLLTEAGRNKVPTGLVSPQGQGTQAASGMAAVSSETYLGFERSSSFASPGGLLRDRANAYPPAPDLRLDQWALSGDWTVSAERASLNRAMGRISYRFQARDLHLALGPAADGKPVRFRVLIDGRPPLTEHGSDVDAQGLGTITTHRLYQLVRQPTNDPARLFEIEFLDGGAQAYAFTFG